MEEKEAFGSLGEEGGERTGGEERSGEERRKPESGKREGKTSGRGPLPNGLGEIFRRLLPF